MKKFIKNLTLFFIPIIILLALYGAALVKSGELVSISDAAHASVSGKAQLFGLTYRNDSTMYKHFATVEAAPELLVLGTSRSMQIRGDFFKDISFYNAGGGAGFMTEMLYFMQNIPKESLPKIAVFVLDQNFYNSAWIGNIEDYDYTPNTIKPIEYLRGMLLDFYKIDLRALLSADGGKLGISANMRRSGYKPDGSYDYGTRLINPELNEDKAFSQTFIKIRAGKTRFEYSEDIYPEALEITQELLQFCKANDIAVVGILPPYAPSVVGEMADSGKYAYIDKLPAALGSMFADYGYEVHNYTLLHGSEDSQFIDGYHGADRVYAALTLDLATRSGILSPYIDTEKLNAFLSANTNPLMLSE